MHTNSVSMSCDTTVMNFKRTFTISGSVANVLYIIEVVLHTRISVYTHKCIHYCHVILNKITILIFAHTYTHFVSQGARLSI